MSVIPRIAARNLIEHKAKTFIIGIIISVGVIVLIVGNSLMDTASLGIERGFIDNYTSHIMIHGIAEGDVSLFGVQSPGGIEDTPTLPKYETIKNYLSERQDIEVVTSQLTGYARLGIDEYEGRSFTVLFGIEPTTYRELFSNIQFVDGRDLKPREEGIVMSTERVSDLEESIIKETEKEAGEQIEFTITAGDNIRLTAFGNAGIKIREVPLIGIFEFKNPSKGLGIDLISYVDVQTIRALNGLTIGFQGEFELNESETDLLDTVDIDSLFNDSFSVEEANRGTPLDTAELDDILGDTTIRDTALQVDTGSWNYFLLKVASPRRVQKTITSLNSWFDEQGIAVRAGDWELAAGPFAKTADVIRQVFNIAIIIVGVVALIIMMNTLVISVIERTSEIGTMRALGAQKNFVWKLFFFETVTITTIFGLAGVILALIIIGVLNLIGIPATNVFLRILFAGDALRPAVSAVSVLTSLLIAVGVGIAAHIYPVFVALKIPPVQALQTE